jgi:lactate dehydrogenase-like 2-hydroxyacid dehydrogenase
VMNSASASTITTAEHAFALMISLARNVSSSNAIFRGGVGIALVLLVYNSQEERLELSAWGELGKRWLAGRWSLGWK